MITLTYPGRVTALLSVPEHVAMRQYIITHVIQSNTGANTLDTWLSAALPDILQHDTAVSLYWRLLGTHLSCNVFKFSNTYTRVTHVCSLLHCN